MATFVNLHQRKEPLFVNLDLMSHIKAAGTAAGEQSQIYFVDGASNLCRRIYDLHCAGAHEITY
jgi:hypothetical protein